MKTKMILGFAITTTIFVTCSNNRNRASENQNMNNARTTSYTDSSKVKTSSAGEEKNTVTIKEILNAYLQVKNAFTDDNSTGAATAGKKLEAAFKNFDKSGLTETQMKTFEDVEADATEHAEHIGASGGNIAHQREHFALLSKDIYDLIKTFGAGQVMYKDFDPMFNNGKGAFWISETKEIRNPYMGKSMLTSGSVQEELK